MIQKKTRRQVLQFLIAAGIFTVSGCSKKKIRKLRHAANFTKETLSGYCSENDAGSVTCGTELSIGSQISDLKQGLSIISEQTITLLSVQKKYHDVIGLKEDSAKVEAVIKKIKSGNVNSVGFRVITNISESSNKAVIAQLKKIERLDEQQKKELAIGLATHRKAIIEAWNGGIIMTRAFLGRPIAPDKNSYNDVQTVQAESPLREDSANYREKKYESSQKEKEENAFSSKTKGGGMKELGASLKESGKELRASFKKFGSDIKKIKNEYRLALKLLNTSKKTYEKYAEAFEHEAKIPLPANQRKLDLETFSLS